MTITDASLKLAKNINKVPLVQWRRWDDTGRRTFNQLYGVMVDEQFLFVHPKAAAVPPKHWNTVAWNAAWTAADAATGKTA
jgi:hypothetical protein